MFDVNNVGINNSHVSKCHRRVYASRYRKVSNIVAPRIPNRPERTICFHTLLVSVAYNFPARNQANVKNSLAYFCPISCVTFKLFECHPRGIPCGVRGL